MNRNTPHIILILVFVFRVMLPIGNPLYFFSELNMGSNDLLNTLYYVSLLLEVAALVMLALGMNDPKARRISAYIAFGLPGLHYAVLLVSFLFLPAARHFLGPVYMTVVTVAYALTAGLAYMTLRSAREMSPCERKPLPVREIDERVDALHDKLHPNS